MNHTIHKEKITRILLLFASSSTLICCALPILLTSIGLGSVLISMVESLPFLPHITQNKDYLFMAIFLLLGINYWWVFKKDSKVIACDIAGLDKQASTPCEEGKSFSKVILWISIIIYMVGFFFAYLLLPLYRLIS